MRSIFERILIWFLGTVALAIVGFMATSWLIHPGHHRGPSFFDKTQALQLDEARNAYVEGGPEKLYRFLQKLDERFKAQHYLVDDAGKDLVGGEDRSAWLSRSRSHSQSGDGLHVMSRQSDDGLYRLLIVAPQPPGIWDSLPAFLWILFVVVMMGYVLAVHLARPIVKLRRAVEQFGGGDLSTRVGTTRSDEIGDLARAFDQMAARIETLLQAERRLLQDVSHELRSPLARLGFAIELARTAPDKISALNRAGKEVDRLGALVSELLELTRVEGDSLSQTVEELPLDDLLEEIVSDCELEAEIAGCRLKLQVDQSVIVRGDRELLRRAVENVIRNAVRHAPIGTVVDVELGTQGELATILVRDRGTGVPEIHLADIFKPFFRVESDRDRASGGVGLGLSIAKRAVSLHRGKIHARSAGPGLAVLIDLPVMTSS